MNILVTIGLILFLIVSVFLIIVTAILLLAITASFIAEYKDKPKSKDDWKIN